MKFLAFDNTWHVIALLWGLLLVRAAVPRIGALRRRRGPIFEVLDSLLVAVLLVFLILRPFVVQAFYIPSGSMLPTLQIDDRILVNKFLYFFDEPQHGDIVVFVSPPQADLGQKDFIKRVTGLPGDRLAVYDGVLWRNGAPVYEPYVMEPHNYRFPPFGGEYEVPDNSLFVMGDNRNLSNDSHKWGPLPRKNVLGKASVIFWPPHRMGLLSVPPPAAEGEGLVSQRNGTADRSGPSPRSGAGL